MFSSHTLVVGIVLVLFAAGGCSELSDDLPPSSGGSGVQHIDGWADQASPNFHGAFLKAKGWEDQECMACHGADYHGGTSGISCFGCHDAYPHPSNGWVNPSSPAFHGAYLDSAGNGYASCTGCHGTDLGGGSSEVSCFGCHEAYPHSTKPGWGNPGAADSHGAYLKANGWDTAECATCHGPGYDGGTSGVSCLACHSTFPHSVVFTAAVGYHPGYLRANLYPLQTCQSCHGEWPGAYEGGRIDVSCTTAGCHVDAAGTAKTPEACNTCHGVFNAPESDLLSPAPPKSVAGGTATSDPRVGAHQAHLRAGLGKAVKCEECHTRPAYWNDPGHITSDLRAEVVFNDTLANLVTNNGAVVPSPAYSATTYQCSSVYCHGTFKNGNLANAPTWNAANQAACGTCHGTLSNPAPTSGHPQGASSLNCQNCHLTGAIPVAQYSSGPGTWSIVDTLRHVNGKVSLFGTENPF